MLHQTNSFYLKRILVLLVIWLRLIMQIYHVINVMRLSKYGFVWYVVLLDVEDILKQMHLNIFFRRVISLQWIYKLKEYGIIILIVFRIDWFLFKCNKVLLNFQIIRERKIIKCTKSLLKVLFGSIVHLCQNNLIGREFFMKIKKLNKRKSFKVKRWKQRKLSFKYRKKLMWKVNK